MSVLNSELSLNGESALSSIGETEHRSPKKRSPNSMGKDFCEEWAHLKSDERDIIMNIMRENQTLLVSLFYLDPSQIISQLLFL